MATAIRLKINNKFQEVPLVELKSQLDATKKIVIDSYTLSTLQLKRVISELKNLSDPCVQPCRQPCVQQPPPIVTSSQLIVTSSPSIICKDSHKPLTSNIMHRPPVSTPQSSNTIQHPHHPQFPHHPQYQQTSIVPGIYIFDQNPQLCEKYLNELCDALKIFH